jgi:hypothetical protein
MGVVILTNKRWAAITPLCAEGAFLVSALWLTALSAGTGYWINLINKQPLTSPAARVVNSPMAREYNTFTWPDHERSEPAGERHNPYSVRPEPDFFD